MSELTTAMRDVAALETAPTEYAEGNGIRFAYRRLGPSTGPPLILLQHFSGNIDAWDPAVVNALATASRQTTPMECSRLCRTPSSSFIPIPVTVRCSSIPSSLSATSGLF